MTFPPRIHACSLRLVLSCPHFAFHLIFQRGGPSVLWRGVPFPENEVMIPPWVEGKGDIVWPGCHHNIMLILNSQTCRAQLRDYGTKKAYFWPFLLEPLLFAL